MTELNIVIPVYNEGANFPGLWQALTSYIQSPFKAIVVYDFDEDNTVPAVQKILKSGESRLKLEKNLIRRGVVGAIRTGFDQIACGPILVVMADLCDDLARVGEMLRLYEQGYHIVVGSRYMRGGAIINGPWLKQTLSRLGSISLHFLRGIPTHDATNAFKIYDAQMLKTIYIESKGGFELNLEITVKAFLAGYKIAEIPTTWCERSQGKSNFKMWRWLPHYLKWYFYAFRPRLPRAQAALL